MKTFNANDIRLLDGGTGTNIFAAGMPPGVCLETWILDNPDVIVRLQRDFIAAGAQAVYAATFGANSVKLAEYGLGDKTREYNLRLVAFTKKAAEGTDVLVGGNLSPTGLFTEPCGDASFDRLLGIYREQVSALYDAGVDFVGVETQITLSDARAALIAAKEKSLPAFVSFTLEENGRTLMGGTLEAAVVILGEMGADAIGLNCCNGPDIMLDALKTAYPYATVPLIAKPNAGKPSVADSRTYDLSPDVFAEKMRMLVKAGASILGGCCGTTPAHIQAVNDMLRGETFLPIQKQTAEKALLATERQVFPFDNIKDALTPIINSSENITDTLFEYADNPEVVPLVRISSQSQLHELAQFLAVTDIPLALTGDVFLLEQAKIYLPCKFLWV